MTVRECLERPGVLRQAISLKRARIETLRRYSVRFSSGLSEVRVQASPDPARMQVLLSEAADEETEVLRLEEELSQALSEAALLVSMLPDAKMIRLLEYRYLECMTWPETLLALDCGSSYAFKLHRKALAFLRSLPAFRGETE